MCSSLGGNCVYSCTWPSTMPKPYCGNSGAMAFVPCACARAGAWLRAAETAGAATAIRTASHVNMWLSGWLTTRVSTAAAGRKSSWGQFCAVMTSELWGDQHGKPRKGQGQGPGQGGVVWWRRGLTYSTTVPGETVCRSVASRPAWLSAAGKLGVPAVTNSLTGTCCSTVAVNPSKAS